MSEQGNIPIAEDLLDDYNDFASKAGGVVVVGWRKYARGLIERCSRAEAERDQFKADASWAATHRSELADLRDAFAKSEAEVAQLKAENLRLKAPVENIARSAAKEIAECFNISIPRGVSYANGILGTIKIIIETHFRGESRDALLTARTQGGSSGK